MIFPLGATGGKLIQTLPKILAELSPGLSFGDRGGNFFFLTQQELLCNFNFCWMQCILCGLLDLFSFSYKSISAQCKRSRAGMWLCPHNHFRVLLCHHLNSGHTLYLRARGCVPGRATLCPSCTLLAVACFLLKYVWKKVPVTEEHLSVVENWTKGSFFCINKNHMVSDVSFL